jgi:hypothetical protein
MHASIHDLVSYFFVLSGPMAGNFALEFREEEAGNGRWGARWRWRTRRIATIICFLGLP